MSKQVGGLPGEPVRTGGTASAASAAGALTLRDLRHARLWTQPELARRARVCVRTIWALETGGVARIDTRRKLLKALAVQFDQHWAVFGPLPRTRP